MLKTGYLADWTAFDLDPIGAGPDAFRNATTLRTVVGGRTVYSAPRPAGTTDPRGTI
jgi:predicted amidohydrolase YtcJ